MYLAFTTAFGDRRKKNKLKRNFPRKLFKITPWSKDGDIEYSC